MISSSTWRCAALHCVALCCCASAAGRLCTQGCYLNSGVGLKTAPCRCYGSLSQACAVLLYFFLFLFFLNIFHFCLVLVKKKKKTSHRRVKVECGRLTMRSVNANAPVAVITSNCSSSRSCAHTVVRVTESDQCYYWRPDGLQGFFLWMVATLFL